MLYLLDTNAISEARKNTNSNRGFQSWVMANDAELWALSVVTLGEIRRGIEGKRKKDPFQAAVLEGWLESLCADFSDRILSVTYEIADRWGRIASESKVSDADGLIAATALEHDLTVVTRNVADFEKTGVRIVNPWK